MVVSHDSLATLWTRKPPTLCPGIEFDTRWVDIINISSFKFQSFQQSKKWNTINETAKKESGWGIEQYFVNEDGTLDYARALKEIQECIDAGKNWVVSIRNGWKRNLAPRPLTTDPVSVLVDATIREVFRESKGLVTISVW